MKQRFPGTSRKWMAAMAVFWAAGGISITSLAAESLTFEDAFNTKGEPALLHYQATFVANGANHRIEVWRDGARRLRRVTDDAIETYVFRQPGSDEFRMTVLDKKKRIRTEINRTNLYRIGQFADWNDLAHGLRHPSGSYRIERSAPPPGLPKPSEPCRWYRMADAGGTTHICWGTASRIPMQIVAAENKLVWNVSSSTRSALPSNTFEVSADGYIFNNASKDLETD